MDTAIQAILTLSLFAGIHERAIEMVRGIAERLGQQRLIDPLTKGPAAVVPAIVVAIATHANALALFEHDSGKMTSKFYEVYLTYDPPFFTPRDLVGCVLMGLSAGLGSKFWHDLAYGLRDMRDRAKALPKDAKALVVPGGTEPVLAPQSR